MVARPVQGFMRLEVAGGLVLLAASIAALVWANLDPSGYHDVWHTQFTVSIGGHGVTDTLLHAVNDGLMGIFFLVVGLEVKRELMAAAQAADGTDEQKTEAYAESKEPYFLEMRRRLVPDSFD